MAHEPAPTHLLGHVSDSHFTDTGTLHGVAVGDRYRAALGALEATGLRLDALVHTGDVADAGDPGAYRDAATATAEVTGRTGWPVAFAVGNHDVRAPFREHLLGVPATDGPIDAVVELDGLRLVVLDTSIPGRVEGALDADQLAWLDAALVDPPEQGVVVALHHAPVPVQVTALQALHLTGQQALAPVVRDRGVRAILGGHVHYATSAVFAGVPVHVAPATAYVIRVGAPGTGVTGVDGGHAAGLLALYESGQVGYTAVPADPAAVVADSAESVFAAMGVDAPR